MVGRSTPRDSILQPMWGSTRPGVLFALAGVICVIAGTTTGWSGSRLNAPVVARSDSIGTTVRWISGPAELTLPTVWWRPVKVTIQLRSPDDVPDDRATVILSIDDVPTRRLTLSHGLRSYVITSTRAEAFTLGLRIQIDDVSPDPRGIGLGTVSVRPSGLSWSAMLLLIIGAMSGFGVWLVLPAAQPFREDTLAVTRTALASGRDGLAAIASAASHGRSRVWFIALLSAIPMAYMIGVIWLYAVDVPFWDEWELVPLLAALYDGTLRLGDLWAFHNEHRILFPQLLMLALAALSDWNIRLESFMSALLAAGTLGVLVRMLRSSAQDSLGSSIWAVPVFSTLVFSARQWENWLWGWQLAIFLNVLAVVGMVRLLTKDQIKARDIGGAVALATIASYSFASGLASWGIGLVALGLVVTRSRRQVLVAWVSASVVAAALYLRGGRQVLVSLSSSNAVSLTRVSDIAAYTARYLGSPLTGQPGTALLLGAVALAVYIGLAVPIIRRRHGGHDTAFVVLGFYPLAAGLLTAVGRGLSPIAALNSRYVTISTLFWVSIVALLSHAVCGRQWSRRTVGRICAVGLIACAAIRSSYDSMSALEAFHARLVAGRKALIADERQELEPLYPVRSLLESRRSTLESLGLSVFRAGSSREE